MAEAVHFVFELLKQKDNQGGLGGGNLRQTAVLP